MLADISGRGKGEADYKLAQIYQRGIEGLGTPQLVTGLQYVTSCTAIDQSTTINHYHHAAPSVQYIHSTVHSIGCTYVH